MRILGHEGIKAVNKDVTTQVASRARARYMLTGSIVQTKPSLIITSQLVDVNNGNVVGSQRVIGESHEELFSLIDRLSTEIKNRPLQNIQAFCAESMIESPPFKS